MTKIKITCEPFWIVANFENISPKNRDEILMKLRESMMCDRPQSEAQLRDRLAWIVSEFYPGFGIN